MVDFVVSIAFASASRSFAATRKPPPEISKIGPLGSRASGFLEALLEIRQCDLIDISARHDSVQAHSVANFARDLQHPLLDRRDRDRNVRMLLRRRRKVRRHQRQVVMLAAEIQRLARLPRLPARAHRTDVIFHPLRRLRPRHPEAPHHMALDLRADPKHQAATAHALEIPRGVSGRDRTLGERERDPGAELDLRRLHRGDRKPKIWIVLRLNCNQ